MYPNESFFEDLMSLNNKKLGGEDEVRVKGKDRPEVQGVTPTQRMATDTPERKSTFGAFGPKRLK